MNNGCEWWVQGAAGPAAAAPADSGKSPYISRAPRRAGCRRGAGSGCREPRRSAALSVCTAAAARVRRAPPSARPRSRRPPRDVCARLNKPNALTAGSKPSSLSIDKAGAADRHGAGGRRGAGRGAELHAQLKSPVRRVNGRLLSLRYKSPRPDPGQIVWALGQVTMSAAQIPPSLSSMRWARALVVLAALASAGAGPGPPRLRWAHALYNVSVAENSPPRARAAPPPAAPPPGLPLPHPDARVRFRIRHGDKDKFFKAEERTVGDFCFLTIRTRAGHADVLNRERRDSYRLDVRATAQLPDGVTLEADTVVLVTVTDVNDLSPLFYPTEYEVTVPEDVTVHSSVARVTAEDADLGINGEIYYSLAEPTEQFAVHPTSGVLTLTRALRAAERARLELHVLARDRASLLARGDAAPAARATLVVHVAQANLHAPELRVRRLPELVENSTAEIYAIVEVKDRDAGEHGRIASLEIVDGDPDGHFRVRPSAQPGEYDVVVHALLDRETAPHGYNLTLRAQDAGFPPRASYLSLPVTLTDANDNAPVFSREVYEATTPETAPPGTPIIRLKVTDRDEGRNARVYIEIVGGNEGGEFIVNPDTGVLYTAVPLDAELKSLYTLTVSAIDQGNAGTRQQSSAKVKITVLDANDNDPVFTKDEAEVMVEENGPSGAVVARVAARDADSGENAYISYSIANLQPVPFDVDHFSGAVRTTRLLDYESMRREYVLRIRASDWGLPYRRQAEMRLTVRLQDVNDNRPQFERVECVGYLPRRLAIGSEITTLSALDFDAGDVVSYRVVGGNEDNCFSLDTGTGVVSLACDLNDIRTETRVLNVTATDGTHFADPTSLTLHLVGGGGGGEGALECRDAGVARRLTELLAAAERSNAPLDLADEFPLAPSRYGENLHSPEFIDFPVEVKVNESVALGTSLVKLRARDRDLGYNGLLVFAISGGDPDSAFRIDPDNGELKVIGYLDRERESEYYLNVTVYDLGTPQRSSSRLLPVTVLDVNDNKPRFEKTLASFRVTENAINGTAIFRANATDRDAGDFARITYSLSGGDGEFCVGRDTGVLSVCAALDRERRALYELSVRATDGGGLRADALVRVAVDDVNDNAPHFGLPAYSARVREDVPAGTLVAVLEAFDPDLGAGGDVTYSLPDQAPEDAVFTVDKTSGTLRTAKPLDFEERQVYGVTVRATDGGRPALWAEATVIVEVVDVDENAHAPTFADPVVLTGRVREDAPRGTVVLEAAATDADPPGRDSRLAYYILGGSGMAHFSIDDAGVIRTLTPLDRESVPHYWLTVAAEDHGLVPRYTTVQVYIDVEDVNDMAPWPERAAYAASVTEHAAAGARVATVTCVDADAAPVPPNITYSIVAGNPDGLFSIDETTGEIVCTGRALDRESAPAHALEVRCWDGALASTARVSVAVLDVNDHAPAFTERFYELRVPGAEPGTAPPHLDSIQGDGAEEAEESSTEWEGEEEDAGRAAWDTMDVGQPQGIYLATVVALDPDLGENGTVRYSARARGAARALLRVHALTGRLYAAPALRRQPGDAYDVTVRACDGGPKPRCGVTRASIRCLPAGGGAPPRVPAVPPLQVAELDAPPFLLAVLQAQDPDDDPLYYSIVGGDERQEFYIGRSDGSLMLARRLLWERQPRYQLNISVSDGAHTVTTLVNITVINDANEAGVSFSREEYIVEAEESVRVGEALAALQAHGATRLLYGIHAARAPASLELFRLHELTGVLELAQPLDRESCALHELTVWARDQAPRAARALARVAVRVHGADEHAPAWGRRLAEARVARQAAPGTLVAALRAADPDAGDAASIVYSLAGGDSAGLFEIEPALGEVRLSRALPARGPRDYTLTVRAAGAAPAARAASLPLHVTVVDPDPLPPRFTHTQVIASVYENEPAGTAAGAVEARGGAGVWYWLEGARGRFRLNPAAGALATAAPLDYEEQNLYNLTVTAMSMGGGMATANIIVHVLDRNEYPPVLRRSSYRGRISEAASVGALVTAVDSDEPGAPLVLEADDKDSPDNQQRAYEILEPEAASKFRVDPTTGALRLASPLDYEEATVHEFTVKVVDMGSPRLPSESSARVTVEVLDVNDCPPRFAAASMEATLLLPTARGVAVLALPATDPDLPRGAAIKYDIIEGDPDGAFGMTLDGTLETRRAEGLADTYRLRVRASDGQYAGTVRVRVRVRGADNAGLAFHKADYYGSVLENSTKPATIAVLNVLGAALNEHIEFRILNPVEGFEVGVTSGAVRSTGVALDREARDSYTLLVQARGGAGGGAEGGRVAHARLHVAVTDVNDNCPLFVERPYVAAVLAGAEPGTPVIRVQAIDADANDNGEVRYEMKRGHGELFRVDRRSGQISLKQTLDAHNQLYTLVIAAFDGGVPACGAEAGVGVRVWGGGAAPRWERAHVALAAREDVAPGQPLAALRALSPLQRQLIYTLVDADPPTADLFEIHFDTAPDRGNSPCAVVARSPLDYEAAHTHALTVRATDGVTGAYADASVTLQLTDVNDCAPDLDRDLYRAAVSEAAALGDLVLVVHATDNDTGANGEVMYSLSRAAGGDNESLALFSIDPESGAVRVAAPLDAELRSQHHLIVTAADKGRPSLHTTAHLFITVDDVNDSEPRLERAVVSALVSVEAARGTAVARVAAWDPDARDAGRLRLALAGAAPERAAFHVDPQSGLLTLGDEAAWAALGGAGARSLNVSVTDGAHAAFARVKLQAAPANRAAPHFPHLVHEARAQDNQPPPVLLTTVKAYDDDIGEYGTITYSIPSAKLRETFAIDSTSGALTSRVVLDREARAEWEVGVTASDGGGLLRHTVVRVRVQDANDNAPAFPLAEYRAAVRADRAPLAPFLTLAARDADTGENARLTYSIYEGDVKSDATGLFHVDPHSGALSFARNASQFASRAVQVWVRARDPGGLAGEAPVSVFVLGAADAAPRVAPPPPSVFLPEDATPGTLIVELRADPPIPNYRLAPGLWPRELFAIDSAGRLVLAGQLDRETAQEHVIGIIAEGSGSPAPATLLQTRLHVLDVNEHAPAFHSAPYVVHVSESTPPHTSLVQLMADDPDAGSNGEVRFSLADEADSALFAVDPYSGWVTTLATLDREARPEHRVPVLAHDNGVTRRTARGTLVVRLVDYNDCPPVFKQDLYSADVLEDAAPGTVVTRLEVDDADTTGSPLTFLVAGGDPRARFQLRATGELLVARALDRETEDFYSLSIAATDGKFTAYTTVNITVLDVNDNPPYCVRHRYRARLSEAAAPGTRVAALLTADADLPSSPGPAHHLSGEHHHHFHIHKDTGVITVAMPLDRETVSSYKLEAHARDRDRPEWGCSSELLVTLDDVNDNSPRFSADEYSVTLPEDADLGTLVAKVHATDADLGENRLVRYSWVEDNASGAFELSPDSGIITLRTALDREQQAEHRLVVRARDAGRPPRSATATVRLSVADVNDNPPEFEFRAYRATVPELDAVGTEILRVRATSRDTGVNADVYYSLVGGDDRDDFTIDRGTGALSIARPLDYERRREYFLTVQAIDGGSPPLSDLATVNVTVEDSNDNAPVFTQASYGARVREDAAAGTRMLQVIADDADAGVNGRVTYSIARGDPDTRFAIDADTGYVSVVRPLDRETTPAYVLEVRARDRGIPSLEATALVNVEVVDANDNPPLFSQSNYSAVVREDRPLGHTILKFEVEDADAPPNSAPYTFDFQSGNEMGAFRLEQDGYLRSATRFNHRIRDRYVLQIRVFDNGTPPLFSDAWVHIRVVEESQYPPVVTPLEVTVNSYLDEFPGGVVGKVFASDRDAYDVLTYALAPVAGAPYAPTDLFEIDSTDGTLRAAPRLDVGDYRLNVTVDDGKFTGFAIVRVTVVLISDELLTQAIVVRFREVTDRDFVLSHRKGFLRAVAEATDCEPSDVVIIGVQPSEVGNMVDDDTITRRRRQVAQDLDVAFAVRSGNGLLPAEALRRRLHAHVERLEERTRLVVEELVRAVCGGCVHGSCVERVVLRGGARVVAADVVALVAPKHALRALCACAPGHAGVRCDVPLSDCKPAPDGSESACCDGPECRTAGVVQLSGDGYLVYRLERGVVDGARLLDDEINLSLRFRTRHSRGTLLHAAGRVDYATLELIDGQVQFRMELGSGAVAVRAGEALADGAWHTARLQRRGAAVRLTVDRRAARAMAPPPHALLDARPDRVLLGAVLARHAHPTAPEQVTYGFHGCLADIKLGGVPLPLEEGGTAQDGRAQLVRRVRARLGAACAPLAPAGACGAAPCQHGGTCRDLPLPALLEGEADDGYTCACHARFLGRHCEIDTDPCASGPCLHGGVCSADGAGGFQCACAAGLSGARCERGRWCAPGVCAHQGACEEGEWGPSCRCRGYFGPRCQFDVDECAGEPCLNGATCLNEPGSFRCLCPPDKTGMNCGNPLYSDAVVAGEAAGARAVGELWRWALAARWPLGALAGAALALLLAALLPVCLRRRRAARARRAAKDEPLNSHAPDKLAAGRPRVSKLSNLEAERRERPASCGGPGSAPEPPPLNNMDTLRSYGSAGDELEGIPPDYLRNLNLDTDRKPWSEQMHLHTFVDNKIYNDLKGCKARRAVSPGAARRAVEAAPGCGSPHLVGGYHWDCSDWCGGPALPGISEVAGSERPDSSSPPPPSPPRRAEPRRPRPRAAPRPPPDTDSAPDDLDHDRDTDPPRFPDASSYLLHPDEYLPRAASDSEQLRARNVREPDAASLITMLEERNSLLGGGSGDTCSELSAHLCEIEDSDSDTAPAPAQQPGAARHTDV
ncbi:fat-like cadherin-related tumor suppressor homolog [Pectinophora gossypiella]|nr:fat-like cadherin-related tumor suppressor homolog [Pectinophora gossypiella]